MSTQGSLSLRKAGDILKSVDHKYAQAIVDMYMGKDRQRGDMGRAAQYLGGTPAYQIGQEGVPRGAGITSAAARYGAPLIGVGMAGNAVGSVTNAVFGGPEDGQQPGQLDVGGLTVASLIGGATPYAAHQAMQYGGASSDMLQHLSGVQHPMRHRAGLAAAGAGAGMLANALGQAIF